jgi:hypothetical protein
MFAPVDRPTDATPTGRIAHNEMETTTAAVENGRRRRLLLTRKCVALLGPRNVCGRSRLTR